MIEQMQFGTREAWLQARRSDVTASQIGCLVDEHPFVTPHQLYLLKTGQAGEPGEETPVMTRGRLMEGVAVGLLRERFPEWIITHNQVPGPGSYFRNARERIGATPDVLIESERGPGIIQIKSVPPRLFKAEWIDSEGTTVAPRWVKAQSVTEAKLAGARWAMVAAIVVDWGIDLHLIEVDLDDGLWERLRRAVAAFWAQVTTGIAPEVQWAQDAALLASLTPKADGSAIDLSDDNLFVDALHERQRLLAQIKTLQADLENFTDIIRVKMGAATVATAKDWVVTNKLHRRRAYQVAASSFRRLVATLKGAPDE